MRTILNLIISILVCSMTPALLVEVYFFLLSVLTLSFSTSISEYGSVFLAVSYVAAAHAVILGLPFYFLVRQFWSANYKTSALGGFIIGIVPIAIYSWPIESTDSNSSFSVNGVWLKIDGEPTFQGWLSYTQDAFIFALLGMAGALSFYYTLTKLKHPNKRMQSDPAKLGR